MSTNLKKVLAQFACEGLDPTWTETLLAAHRELASLEQDRRTLTALEHAGVDNWEWYGDAMSSLGEG